MKKLTKILTAALCLAAMLTFAACGGNKIEEEKGEDVNYNLALFCKGNGALAPIQTITDKTEAATFADFAGSEMKFQALKSKIEAYDESFFETKSLVLVSVVYEKYWTPAKISSVKLDGSVLTVTVSSPDESFGGDALTEHLFVLEMDKADLEKATVLKMKTVKRGERKDYDTNIHNWMNP